MSTNETVIVGLGETGLSVAKHLAARKKSFKVIDSRDHPPALEILQKLMPEIEIEVGELNQKTIIEARESSRPHYILWAPEQSWNSCDSIIWEESRDWPTCSIPPGSLP